MKRRHRNVLLLSVLLALLASAPGCMTRAEHAATLATIEGPTLRVADEYIGWAKALAGDSDGDGKVTEADDFDAARAKLPLSKDSPAVSRNVWLNARLQRDAQLRGVFEDERTPTTQGS